MRLDRNISPGHPGKYALIKLRKLGPGEPSYAGPGNELMIVPSSAVDFGIGENDFFVIRLKDNYAEPALAAYANAAAQDDEEYAKEIALLAEKAAHHPHKRRPD